jgi:hypothetical protein
MGIGVYYGFDEGFDFSIGNDGHILIDQFGGTQLSDAVGAASLNTVEMQATPEQVDGTALVPLNVSA